ncbi:ABC-type nitrate/sulfonate/bicarbonate transport system, ATPase component [Burkholderia sp. YR290]|jgi:NitT/TauT family transport system ATP-binding protein|uniref:ABC transporter ATP-binding protein n=1 Tax=Paraburkholderia hospita TaxID=169430 RepID=UPI0009A654BF|nr:ABC transporter ATP-binding protein [Paraburkholderia hospita]SKC89193.1 ABC-type nitrate/sulfonate/bicarbonate transport system, ATPase component [Paraburkholderia hospita]SOE85990.1 ABC-type nitrate/sulfonate/bicarbonate transport system, ATPase component [Burkholderia sp. YR290]
MSTAPCNIVVDRGQTAMREALRFDNVTCTFAGNGKNAQTYTAVSGGNLAIGDGEFVSIVGPTGCGKSTLLNVAAGLTRPSSGSLSVFGEKLTNGLNKQAAYLFQVDALMPWKTAEENIAMGLIFRGTPHDEALKVAHEWLERVGLHGHGKRYPHQMSGGMRKRAGLAQALALNPRIILMDEPFSALDIQTRHLMENELLRLWSHDRKSVMFVTHDLEEAISLSDRVIVLSAGPGTRPIAEFEIDLVRPREMSEIRMTQRFLQLHTQIWDVLRGEVLKSYARNRV